MHDHWICYNKLPNSSTNDPRIPLDIRLWIRGSFVLIICSSKGSHHYFIAIIFTPGRVLKKSPHPKEGVAIAFYLEIILVITGAKQNMPCIYIYIYFVSCAFIGIISSERMKFEFLYIYRYANYIYIYILQREWHWYDSWCMQSRNSWYFGSYTISRLFNYCWWYVMTYKFDVTYDEYPVAWNIIRDIVIRL